MYTMSGEQLDYRLVSEEGGGGRSVERDAEGRGNRGREQRTSADVEGRYRLYRQSHIAIPGIETTPSSYGRRREAPSTNIDRTRIQQRYKQRHARSLPSSLLFTCPSHTSPIPLPYLSHVRYKELKAKAKSTRKKKQRHADGAGAAEPDARSHPRLSALRTQAASAASAATAASPRASKGGTGH